MFPETVDNLKQAIVTLRAREVENIEEKAKLQREVFRLQSRINDLEEQLALARARQ